MLDDEIQRLSHLFKQKGDKTGFVRLFSDEELIELYYQVVIEYTIKALNLKIDHYFRLESKADKLLTHKQVSSFLKKKKLR